MKKRWRDDRRPPKNPTSSALDRAHFMKFNAAKAEELARQVPSDHVVVVAGLTCPMARNLAEGLNGHRPYDTSGYPKGTQPTAFVGAPRQLVAAFYEEVVTHADGVLAQLRAPPSENTRLVLFVSNGGTLAAHVSLVGNLHSAQA